MVAPKSLAIPLAVVSLLAACGNAGSDVRGRSSDVGSEQAAAGELVPAGAMRSARSGHTATLLGNGKVLIAGGMERNGAFYDSAELFDPSSGQFVAADARMTIDRAGHTATLLRNGKVLIAGGWSRSGVLSSAELYDPAANRFTATGSMRTARGDFTATLLRDGRVLVAGGEGDRALAQAEIYDPSIGLFSPAGNMNVPRTEGAATVLPDNKVLVAGGGEYGAPVASAELYDPATNAFTLTGTMAVPRYKHAAKLLAAGDVLVIGGSDGRDWRGRHASAELYDPSTGAFSRVANMNEPRFKLPDAVVELKDGRVLIAGGSEVAEVYDPGTRRFRTVAGRMDAARFYSTATLLADGRVLIAGGYDESGRASAKAWIYKDARP